MWVYNPAMRPWIAAAASVAGIWLLAGPGWALLVAAALIAFIPATPGTAARMAIRVRAGRSTARSWVARRWRWLAADRQRLAALAMPVGVTAIGVGLGLALGPGYGLAVAGVCVAGLSLAADRAG